MEWHAANGGSLEYPLPVMAQHVGSDWEAFLKWTVKSLQISPTLEGAANIGSAWSGLPEKAKHNCSEWGDIPNWTAESLEILSGAPRSKDGAGFAVPQSSNRHSTEDNNIRNKDYFPAGAELLPHTTPLSDSDN